MTDGSWVGTTEACKFYGVSISTIIRWSNNGEIKYKRTSGNHRRYFISSGDPEYVKEPKESTKLSDTRKKYIYIRVSSAKQKDDMARQRDFLCSKYPDYTVIEDVGSGLNYKRKGLLRMLEESNNGKVTSIVIFSKDRLCRFGFELLQWQFSQNNTELLVHDKSDKTPEQEFSEDILAILQVFACRWNGKRKYRIDKDKEVQIEIKQSSEETSTKTLEQL